MDIELKASKIMDRLGEDNVLRANIPYNNINVTDRNGVTVNLVVEQPYIEDCYGNYGFVTTRNLNRMHSIDPVESKHKITLGCDPEIIVVDKPSGSIIPMCNYLRKQGSVGSDGNLLELRPEPSDSPVDMCSKLRDLLSLSRNLLDESNITNKNSTLCARSEYNGTTAGFHLHYGIPKNLLHSKGHNTRAARFITKVMDYYVGIPSIIPEGNDDANRRTAPFVSYGKPGGFRLNRKTFEYRMPGGVNLSHPLLAVGLSTIGLIVVDDVISRLSEYTNSFSNISVLNNDEDLDLLYSDLPDTKEYFNIICNRDITVAASNLGRVADGVRNMVGYSKMSAAVESYFKILLDWESIRKDINSLDIEKNWRIGEHESS